MIWVVAVVIVSEIVIFVQLMLVFQKRGARLEISRAPILKRIERHKQDLGELAEKIQISTKESLEPLDEKIAGFTHSTSFAENLVAELENEAHEHAQELGLNANDEDEDEDEEKEEEGGDEEEDCEEAIAGAGGSGARAPSETMTLSNALRAVGSWKPYRLSSTGVDLRP